MKDRDQAGRHESAVKIAERRFDLHVGFSARGIIVRPVDPSLREAMFQAIEAARTRIKLSGPNKIEFVAGIEPITNSHGNQCTLFVRRQNSNNQVWLHSKPASSAPTPPAHQ
jgi:hypothetical protein